MMTQRKATMPERLRNSAPRGSAKAAVTAPGALTPVGNKGESPYGAQWSLLGGCYDAMITIRASDSLQQRRWMTSLDDL
jgi:hypothetical protein